MKRLSLRDLTLHKVGAVCALATVACFVVGIALMVSSGVEVLIPETGASGREWIADVDAAGGAFFVGAWLVVFGGLFGMAAMIGFWDALKEAGPALIFAPIAGAVGLTLVTISHVIPVAMAYELVPGYGDGEASLAVTTDTLATISQLTNYVGNALGWGVVVPLYAFAILSTRVVARWLGWLALFVGVLGGWIGLLSPASSFIEGITFPAFLGFFVWLAGMGVALLRRRDRDELAPVVAAGGQAAI